MNGYCDLHTHSTCSDGRYEPEALLRLAVTAKIHYLSLTDHNKVIGQDEYNRLSSLCPEIVLIPGAEMSALYRPDGWGEDIEVHIITLCYSPGQTPNLNLIVEQNKKTDRREYITRILDRLRFDCGMDDIGTYDELRAECPSSHLGRMSIAKHLCYKKYVESVDEAFQIYLGEHGERRAYVKNPIQYATMEQVVRAAVSDGAIPILAHLFYYDSLSAQEQENLVRRFREAVGNHPAGLEVFYRRYCNNPALIGRLQQLADLYNLYPSCGSDFHGQSETDSLHNDFPASIYQNLFAAHQHHYVTPKIDAV